MFDTRKFGKALSTLRKNADMTQNEVSEPSVQYGNGRGAQCNFFPCLFL